jgi:hypothetical protein
MSELVQGTTNSLATLQEQRNLKLVGRTAIRMPERLRIWDCGLRIADCGLKTGRGRGQKSEEKRKKKGILLWERLSAAILRLELFLRFLRFDELTS